MGDGKEDGVYVDQSREWIWSRVLLELQRSLASVHLRYHLVRQMHQEVSELLTDTTEHRSDRFEPVMLP